MAKQIIKTEKPIPVVFCGDCKFCEPYKHTVSYCEHPRIRMPIQVKECECLFFDKKVNEL